MKKLTVLMVLGFILTVSSQALAIPITTSSGPQLFEFVGGTGWIDNPANGYQLTLTGQARIDLTDRLLIGDQYRLFVNGVNMMTTSTPNVFLNGFQTGATTFAQAWANPYLSKGSLYLGPGNYQLDIQVIRVASGVNYGSGWIQAVAVPEPSVLLMLGVGILIFGLFMRRKPSQKTTI
jgi:hypothetical protein